MEVSLRPLQTGLARAATGAADDTADRELKAR